MDSAQPTLASPAPMLLQGDVCSSRSSSVMGTFRRRDGTFKRMIPLLTKPCNPIVVASTGEALAEASALASQPGSSSLDANLGGAFTRENDFYSAFT